MYETIPCQFARKAEKYDMEDLKSYQKEINRRVGIRAFVWIEINSIINIRNIFGKEAMEN